MNSEKSILFLRTMLLAAAAAALPILSAPAVGSENEDFRFAQKLEHDGMYIAAAEEYKRFADKYPSSELRPAALFGSGEAWMKAGRASDALDSFRDFLAAYPADEGACKARFYRGDIMRALGRFAEGAAELLMVEESYPDCPIAGQALLAAGECLISAGDPHSAAGVLRRLVNSGKNDDIEARGMYSLSIALTAAGRDLEADAILASLVKEHKGSPVVSLALLRLGDRSFEKGDLVGAERCFREAAEKYEEESLRQRAMSRIVDVVYAGGIWEAAVEESDKYLEEFPASQERPAVFRKAIDSAWRLDRHAKALELIDAWASEGTLDDPDGGISLLKCRILAGLNRTDDALALLQEFRHSHARSPLLGEAILLEADMLQGKGALRDAAARLNLLLLEGAVGEDRVAVLSRLADISVSGIGDTLTALGYWRMIADEFPNAGAAEKALWNSASARSSAGDTDGAVKDLVALVRRFPEGEHHEAASEMLRRLNLLPKPSFGAVSEMARYATSEGPQNIRNLRIGIILLDSADDPQEAVEYLERVSARELPDSLAAMTAYYVGKAANRLYELSEAYGRPDEGKKKKAESAWLAAARDFPGSEWGGKAHRGYLEMKMREWKPEERLRKIDEFLAYYGKSRQRWWALEKKVEYLYDAAASGREWAMDSVTSVCRTILSSGPPPDTRREVLLRSGYIMRLKGDHEGAAVALSSFAAEYPGDERIAAVQYDLGESYLEMKDYTRAHEAYSACISSYPYGSLLQKALMRKGDCLYYLRNFEGAARVYGEIGSDYAETAAADEAAYRESLSLERMGRYARSDSILAGLSARTDVAPGLRARVLGRLGQRLIATARAMEAKALLTELVSVERTHANLVLLGEARYETGDYIGAAESFSDALRFEGVDTCRALAGRASSRFMSGDSGGGEKDLGRMLEIRPGYQGAAAVLLVKGRLDAEAGRCEEAEAPLLTVRERYAGTEEAARSLFYLAVCDLKRGGYAEAVGRLSAFLRESPQTPILDQAYFKLASAHFAAGNRKLAAEYYGLAAESSADAELSFIALKNRAMIFQELEEWDKAAAAWYAICEKFPAREDIVEMFFNLGFAYGQSGRYEMALEVYNRIPGVASSEEQQGRAYYWSGISLKSMDRCEEAIRNFLRVPYLKTGGMWGITSRLEAAVCYERIGQIEQAVGIYERILSAHGENTDWGSLAKKALDRIKGSQGSNETGTR